jgi:ubiquinone/menaquinone biosynthesis C-methylase UbiE
VESNQDFLTDVRSWVQSNPSGLFKTARARAVEVLKAHGHAPDAELPMAQVIQMLKKDPTIMASARAWLATQSLTWKGVKDAFDAHRDQYIQAMRDAEKKGPGTLELAPQMVVPAYAKHEIHIQPGGYVGDPLAGYIYHYGTNNFWMGHNYQDEQHAAIAAGVPLPKDGKVKRILEIGCSIGQTTMALKDRFPEAEVWGIDVGGPMVHYAHMRASDLGSEVHFRQALAEKTGFPDGHFDIVASFIILHEVPNAVNTQIMKEVARLLRPEGVYYPVDFYTSFDPPKNAYGKFHRWWDHRWNNEPWALEHMEYDLTGDLKAVGMEVSRTSRVLGPGYEMTGGLGRNNIVAVKRA